MACRVELREVEDDDLPLFFQHQLDAGANHMAAFTREEPEDRAAFDAHWKRIRGDDAVMIRTVLADGQVAGHVASFDRFDQREVTYWLGREHWGRGVATRALRGFLREDRTRPIFARVAVDNVGSRRVLEKCGFSVVERDRAHAPARGAELEELVLRLETLPEG